MPRMNAKPGAEINHVLQRLNVIGGCQTFWLLIKLNSMSSNSGLHIKLDEHDTAPVQVFTLSFVFSFCVNIIITGA